MATFVQQYQTLIVGILGFTGVMATLAINAWLARKAERRKIEHETRVLRIALTEEMKVQRDALIHGSDTAQRAKETSSATDPPSLDHLVGAGTAASVTRRGGTRSL
ncbi:MAG TPA: hypothetical protein VGG62_12090 [Terracidiphilus sp.]|jgi:hypothetical protein